MKVVVLRMTCSQAQKLKPVSVPVAIRPMFCIHHTVCAVGLCLAYSYREVCLLPDFKN